MHSSENAYSILARVLMLNAASELRVKYIKDMPYDGYEESRKGKNAIILSSVIIGRRFNSEPIFMTLKSLTFDPKALL